MSHLAEKKKKYYFFLLLILQRFFRHSLSHSCFGDTWISKSLWMSRRWVLSVNLPTGSLPPGLNAFRSVETEQTALQKCLTLPRGRENSNSRSPADFTGEREPYCFTDRGAPGAAHPCHLAPTDESWVTQLPRTRLATRKEFLPSFHLNLQPKTSHYQNPVLP